MTCSDHAAAHKRKKYRKRNFSDEFPISAFIFIYPDSEFFTENRISCSLFLLFSVAVLYRSHPVSFLKETVEVLHILVSYAFRDTFYGHAGIFQQGTGFFHPDILQYLRKFSRISPGCIWKDRVWTDAFFL